MKIKIEKKPFSVTKFVAGSVRDTQGEYEFTLNITEDLENGTTTLNEIVWLEETPVEQEIAEDLIRMQYD